MKILLQVILLIFLLSSCTYYVFPPKVKTRIQYGYDYKPKLINKWETSKWRKEKILLEYIRYDKKGNEIEIGEYGEKWGKKIERILPDSSVEIMWLHGRYPKKLNKVTYKTYNDSNQLKLEEVWRFKNNKKDYLVYKADFKYNKTKLLSITEYDSEGKIIKEKNYDTVNSVTSEYRKRKIFEPFVRIDGKSIDTITYDTSGREIEKLHYFNGQFSRRTVTIYNEQNSLVTTLLYDYKPDSLWFIKELRYDFLTKRPIREYSKVLNSPVENKHIYIYNRKKLMTKILHYSVDVSSGKDKLQSYYKYKYKLY